MVTIRFASPQTILNSSSCNMFRHGHRLEAVDKYDESPPQSLRVEIHNTRHFSDVLCGNRYKLSFQVILLHVQEHEQRIFHLSLHPSTKCQARMKNANWMLRVDFCFANWFWVYSERCRNQKQRNLKCAFGDWCLHIKVAAKVTTGETCDSLSRRDHHWHFLLGI